MSNLPEKHIIDECMNKILKLYIDNGCSNLELSSFDKDSKEFSISFTGHVPRITFTQANVNDRGINRTFAFLVYQEYATCYADDWLPSKIDHYSYIGEIAKHPEKPTILYECDGRACKEPCNKECHHTLNISHAKNFEYKNGIWIERRDYSPKKLYC